ncbi:sulfotransferase [Actinoplanes sp. NPDC051851]|uniref:sulfotransferase family protein n=1 Tax=Actinoplanes sp. NPDC051851 TaxID=3154753 RepID=UPI0034124FB6
MTAGPRTDVGTVEDLHASATRITGLDDFGDEDYRQGLRKLLLAYAETAALTPVGSKATRGLVRGALVSRLLSEAAWRQYPEHAGVRIERPVFITGLPRTGTTTLHRLLTADPAHQGLELWLTEAPQPRPPRWEWADHPVYAVLSAAYRRHTALDGVHHLGPDQIEECWRLLCQSMTSVSFECTAYIPDYADWLAGNDWTAAYRRHRRNLRLIGMADRGRRWILKNPSHLFALDALLAVYPDAVVVRTHRDPAAAIASVCSLNARAAEGWSAGFRGALLGRSQLALWSRGERAFRAARARHDAGRFIDVDYRDFAADPLRVVGRIYDRLGTPLSGTARAAMEKHLSGTPKPAHEYDLASFGLTDTDVAAAME